MHPNYAYICVVHVATHYLKYIAHKWYVQTPGWRFYVSKFQK